MPTISELQAKLAATVDGFVAYLDYQIECLTKIQSGQLSNRLTLYYRTGAGKSITALSAVAAWGYTEALVVAPPITHPAWVALGEKLGVTVEAISHAKFRMEQFKASRSKPVIGDEMHLFGGHDGKGWKKLDAMAAHLKAPLVMCSATPNYNDAERCYCIQHVMDPASCRGGFLSFIYQNCKTRENPFGRTPIVEGFLHHPDAESYLRSLPYVLHVPDLQTVNIVDIDIPNKVPAWFDEFGFNDRTGRIMASQMEERWQRMFINRIDDNGFIWDDLYDILTYLVGQASTPVLIYCDSERVATALKRTMDAYHVSSGLITGKTSARQKRKELQLFINGNYDVLVGTATLATGTDGLDKMCDMLIIVNDTTDNALRKQLCGRILPRGDTPASSAKQVYRLVG